MVLSSGIMVFSTYVPHMLPLPTNWTVLCFQTPVIIITDLPALNYILSSPEFEKTPEDREALAEFVGNGWPNFFGICNILYLSSF